MGWTFAVETESVPEGAFISEVPVVRISDETGQTMATGDISCSGQLSRLVAESAGLSTNYGLRSEMPLKELIKKEPAVACQVQTAANLAYGVMVSATIQGTLFEVACPPNRGEAPARRPEFVEGINELDTEMSTAFCLRLAELGCVLSVDLSCPLSRSLEVRTSATVSKICNSTSVCAQSGSCTAVCSGSGLECVPVSDRDCSKLALGECELQRRCKVKGTVCRLAAIE
ncbi:MAG: hypothetical protein H6706_09775 [Myxococcales bacterium]|nr:hypothetical protein [Myxococcales bacterium]